MQKELLDHSKRTTKIAYLFGKHLKLSERDLANLCLSAKYHDIGKEYIDNSILYKKRKLTAKEFEIIKKHPNYSYSILLATENFNNEVLRAVKEHHERVDGTGYPLGLKGSEIFYISKILSICDSYETMTGNRFYKAPLLKTETIQEIKNGLNTQFDRELGMLFIDFLEEEINSTYVI